MRELSLCYADAPGDAAGADADALLLRLTLLRAAADKASADGSEEDGRAAHALAAAVCDDALRPESLSRLARLLHVADPVRALRIASRRAAGIRAGS